jgi:hypothetical protein
MRTAAQLEDAPCPEPDVPVPIVVGTVGPLARQRVWSEQGGHARRRCGRGRPGLGYFLRSSGVIARITSDPWRICCSKDFSLSGRFSARGRAGSSLIAISWVDHAGQYSG